MLLFSQVRPALVFKQLAQKCSLQDEHTHSYSLLIALKQLTHLISSLDIGFVSFYNIHIVTIL